MGFDVSKLKTSAEAQNLMNNARRMGREDAYQAAFARKCELESQVHDDPNDPMVKDFWLVIAAYEQLLSAKNEKRTAASRTRQKVARVAASARSLVGVGSSHKTARPVVAGPSALGRWRRSWARKRNPAMGFQLLSA